MAKKEQFSPVVILNYSVESELWNFDPIGIASHLAAFFRYL